MKRPRVITRCVADAYHASGERIIEVAFGNEGAGALISLRTLPDGSHRIEVYRVDDVTVFAPEVPHTSASREVTA